MLSVNQKYKEYKHTGGTLSFNDWVEAYNHEHLNIDGKEIVEKAKEKAKDFFKPSDQSKVKSGITILGIPASTFMVITVGVIIIGTVYYYKTHQTQAA